MEHCLTRDAMKGVQVVMPTRLNGALFEPAACVCGLVCKYQSPIEDFLI